jgi:aconitase A
MTEGIAEVLETHGTWRYTHGAGTGIVCSGCGAPVGNLIAHQAAELAAAEAIWDTDRLIGDRKYEDVQ